MSWGPQEQHWVGDGFYVHTLITPSPKVYPYISPFLLLDYAPPKHFDSGTKRRGVGEHPHRGFETVTFAFAGEVEHRDSGGGGGVIRPGDVQWMTAAKGVVHDEFHSTEFTQSGGLFSMVQLWVNLPAKDKMANPKYQGIKSEQCPIVTPTDGVSLKIFAGEYLNEKGPCSSFTPINLFDIDIQKGCGFDLELPDKTNTLILILKGEISVLDKSFSHKDIIIFEQKGELISIKANQESKLLILNGEPIDEPVAAYGPFVMNTREELVEAFNDYQAGKMGNLP